MTILTVIQKVLLPFSIAFLFILSYAYDLDPLMVFWGVSETVRNSRSICGRQHAEMLIADRFPYATHQRAIRQEIANWQVNMASRRGNDPSVRADMLYRVTFLTIVLVACATTLFTLVPGHRL